MTILIADSGSTKTDWIVYDFDSRTQKRFASAGLNPCLMDDADIMRLLTDDVAPHVLTKSAEGEDSAAVDFVHFYGAGCRPDQIERMQRLIGRALRAASVHVASDLLGAAHALCGHDAGIVAILGTGSGSAVFNGDRFIAQTPSLGYILGDEGSGAALGRRLVSDLYKRVLPEHLLRTFEEEQQTSLNDVIHNVYRAPAANRYLAQFTRFISAHLDDADIRALVVDEFKRFFTRNCSAYNRRDLAVNFVGSIAHVFRQELQEAAHETDFTIGRILPSPIESLCEFCIAEHLPQEATNVNN